MAYATNPVVLRIEWCRRQRAKARTEPEMEGWHAEEEGLKDALLNRDHTNEYRQSPPEVFERYLMGFQDGRAVIRVAWVERSWHPAANQTHLWFPVHGEEPSLPNCASLAPGGSSIRETNEELPTMQP